MRLTFKFEACIWQAIENVTLRCALIVTDVLTQRAVYNEAVATERIRSTEPRRRKYVYREGSSNLCWVKQHE